MGDVLAIYEELGLSKETTVFVTSISPPGADHFGDAEPVVAQGGVKPPHILWLASGAGVKRGHVIGQPVSLIDTGATVMRALGLDTETHTEWQSRVINDVFTNGSGVAGRTSETEHHAH
jgi:arylsulfatase A-like enzyme